MLLSFEMNEDVIKPVESTKIFFDELKPQNKIFFSPPAKAEIKANIKKLQNELFAK